MDAAGLEGLVDEATRLRFAQALGGEDVANRLQIGNLAPGDVGVVEALVVQVHPVRTYQRKKGGTGELCRVTLADASGEADLVLWDDEVRQVRDGLLRPGARIRLRGPTAKPGFRSGIELGLGSALLEALPPPAVPLCSVSILSIGTTRIIEGPPTCFQAEAVLGSPTGPLRVVLEGETLRQALAATLPVDIEGLLPHPALEEWMLATPATRIVQAFEEKAR